MFSTNNAEQQQSYFMQKRLYIFLLSQCIATIIFLKLYIFLIALSMII